jgi:hypothetical protein
MRCTMCKVLDRPVWIALLVAGALAGCSEATTSSAGESADTGRGAAADTARPTFEDTEGVDIDWSDTQAEDSGTPQADSGADAPPADTGTATDASGACGNGTVEQGEECDDGNRLAGDGCSNLCRVECGSGNDDDFDGVCNPDDRCPGSPDSSDADGDGVPDGCDGDFEDCGDGIDNDGDGATDCADPECAGGTQCQSLEVSCTDRVDNDGDGDVDCSDSDCALDAICELGGGGGGTENCTNGIDDNGDSFIDCDDIDCILEPVCDVGFGENCTNGRDDDFDGAVDCADILCVGDPACSGGGGGTGGAEDCLNGIDDDLDGDTDCDDVSCSTESRCAPTGRGTCADPFVLGGFGSYQGSFLRGDASTTSGSCGLGTSTADRVVAFSPPVAGRVCIDSFNSQSGLDTVLFARTSCSDASTEIACNDDTTVGPALTSNIEFTSEPGRTYFVWIDSLAQTRNATWGFRAFLCP